MLEYKYSYANLFIGRIVSASVSISGKKMRTKKAPPWN